VGLDIGKKDHDLQAKCIDG